MTYADFRAETPRRRASDRAPVVIEADIIDAGEVVEARPLRTTRPDPSFVTHLIAIAERYPQTRVLRRASPGDATTAYKSASMQGQTLSGGLTRHSV
jgi:hypothetical protein